MKSSRSSRRRANQRHRAALAAEAAEEWLAVRRSDSARHEFEAHIQLIRKQTKADKVLLSLVTATRGLVDVKENSPEPAIAEVTLDTYLLYLQSLEDLVYYQ